MDLFHLISLVFSLREDFWDVDTFTAVKDSLGHAEALFMVAEEPEARTASLATVH